jgi:hypothetical protein
MFWAEIFVFGPTFHPSDNSRQNLKTYAKLPKFSAKKQFGPNLSRER